MAGRIYNNYTNSTLEIIHEDPYRLSVDIDGISFTKADQIAQQFGLDTSVKVNVMSAVHMGTSAVNLVKAVGK